MKALILSATLAALTLGVTPAVADGPDAATHLTTGPSALLDPGLGADLLGRRGRGRGGDGGGHGGRPRVPGGSGCDDPHDLLEHPECRVR